MEESKVRCCWDVRKKFFYNFLRMGKYTPWGFVVCVMRGWGVSFRPPEAARAEN